MKRTPFVCGNWKLHHLLAETLSTLDEMLLGTKDIEGVELAVAPVATVLFAACEKVTGHALQIAAQNVFYASRGAFTGEWSVQHLKELGCSYALVGHSERRQFFGETDLLVHQKALACLEGGLVPIVCVGESLEERAQGKFQDVLHRQVQALMQAPLPRHDFIMAYEPVWAIGTGQVASPEQANEAHAFIRSCLRKHLGDKAESIRIVYGGSVNSDNAASLAEQEEIDGALVGGASLRADSFAAIAQAVARAKT